MDVGLTDWDFVRGSCRDAGKLGLVHLQDLFANLIQDCGIRYKRSSPTSCQHTQQSEPYGQTCLRPRGKVLAALSELTALITPFSLESSSML